MKTEVKLNRFVVSTILITFLAITTFGQQPRVYTRADFVNIEGGNLSARIERAVRQFKGTNQGTSVWLAYHFPQVEGLQIGPFSGMVYRDDDGIRLDRTDKPSEAAVFLLADTTTDKPVIKRITTLNLSEPYKFENRPVYWLGNADANESIALLDSMRKENPTGESVGRSALRAIALHSSPRAVALLKDAAQKETPVEVQRAAIQGLGRNGSAEATTAVIEIYDAAGSSNVLKEEAISALARSSDRRAAEKLLTIAKTDANPDLRKAAIRRLPQMSVRNN